MECIREVDFNAIDSSGPEERLKQTLLDHASGAQNCSVFHIKPPGGGSPAGLHVHEVDQIFYILGGTMSIEIEGRQHECPPGTLIVFPAGIPHRNWNGASDPPLHLAFNTPLPDPGRAFSKPV
jgi:quercetin dioxygenase-like cupin family protein